MLRTWVGRVLGLCHGQITIQILSWTLTYRHTCLLLRFVDWRRCIVIALFCTYKKEHLLRATHTFPHTYDGKHTHPGPFTSIHAHCCFQSTQDPPLWMSLTTCSSPNYLGWFPPDPTSLTPLPKSISICVFFPFFFSFLLFFFSSSHISPGYRVLKIYERYSGSFWPHQSFPFK